MTEQFITILDHYSSLPIIIGSILYVRYTMLKVVDKADQIYLECVTNSRESRKEMRELTKQCISEIVEAGKRAKQK